MIERDISPRLKGLFEQYPFVTVTGPRQSGKTTLCRSVFPDLNYANLEAPDQRDFAERDPRGFLAQLGQGAIIDEIQHVPELLSYLQVMADETGGAGLYVLTGSEQFRLSDAINQSLAGRTALLRLLPFSIAERERIGASLEIDEMIFAGFYPRLLDRKLEPRQALGDYFETYVERDVRRLGGVRDLSTFRRFVRLCAGRVGQLVNLSSLGSDVGVKHPTIREWLNILEASYVVFQLPPFHANLGKRLIRSPKLYFHDVGLASYLLGIERAEQVATHPLRGALFENLVVTEAMKHRFNRAQPANLSFLRDSKGLECDLIYETGHGLAAIEIKSGATVSSEFIATLNRVEAVVPEVAAKAIVYGGLQRQARSDCDVVPLFGLSGLLERLEVGGEVEAFLHARRSQNARESDVATLDQVHLDHVQPILEAVSSSCQPIGTALFASYHEVTSARGDTPGVSGNHVLDPEHWQATRDSYVATSGFSLSDDGPVELSRQYNFSGYNGMGRRGFRIALSLAWTLTSSRMIRTVSIDGDPIPELHLDVPYSELDRDQPDSNLVVAGVLRSLMRSIEDRAGG